MKRLGECRSCHAPMLWTVMPSGKKNPLDPEPRSDGRIVIEGDPEAPNPSARYLRRGEEYSGDKYVSHFSTCPNRQEHRK